MQSILRHCLLSRKLWQTDTYYKISKTIDVVKYCIENLYLVFFHSLALTASSSLPINFSTG